MPRASSRHLEFVTTTYQGAGSFIFFTFWEKSIVLGESCILLSKFHLFCIPSTDQFLYYKFRVPIRNYCVCSIVRVLLILSPRGEFLKKHWLGLVV